MGVHDVERHLDRIESETVIRRHLQHMQMNPGVLVPRETDITEFSRFAGLHERGIVPFVIKNPVRVFVTDHFVVLDEIDPVGLEAAERLVELPRRFLL